MTSQWRIYIFDVEELFFRASASNACRARYCFTNFLSVCLSVCRCVCLTTIACFVKVLLSGLHISDLLGPCILYRELRRGSRQRRGPRLHKPFSARSPKSVSSAAAERGRYQEVDRLLMGCFTFPSFSGTAVRAHASHVNPHGPASVQHWPVHSCSSSYLCSV